MNLRKAFHKVYFMSVLVIAVLIGTTSVSSLVNHDPVEKIKEFARAPASISIAENQKFTDVIEMNCGQNVFKSGALQIRLKGVLCNGLALNDLKETIVKNNDTGDSISVFKMDHNQFTTDFIHLEKGENHISLTQANKSYEIVVVR